MTHFPLFFNLENKNILIFGGGTHALQKIRKLIPFSPVITVISPTISEEIKNINGIKIFERDFSEDDLNINPLFVITAENQEKTEIICAECRKRHIPVNAVDKPRYCDIIFPAVISGEHLCIGISSGGMSPAATVELKEKIENIIPENIDLILEWMLYLRENVVSGLPQDKKKKALRVLFKNAMSLGRPLSKEETENILLNL